MALAANDADDFGTSEAVSKQIFTPYICKSSAFRGLPHAGDIAEASSLSAIPLPPSDYPLWDALPEVIVQQGKLSQLQLEGVLYACTRHQQILPSGERAGFFIGDGAGVGKGRQISGVILDNYARGRRRHIWLSTSSDLNVDAARDVRDLGAYIPLINGCAMLDKGTRALGLDKELQEGVLFLTYSTLISAGRNGKSRMDQVLEWLAGGSSSSTAAGGAAGAADIAAAARAWDGVLVFDECHKAKNFTPGKEAQSTKVASAVIEIQALLPNARVLYCSATGVSEVANMAYMARMGLWGPSSPFPDFTAFLESMKKRGVSFMELLAMEMKAAGRYVARGLSFRQAEFLQVEAPLSPDKVAQYDAAVALWQQLRVQLELALQLAGSSNRDVWKMFWAAQQRFFKLLCIGLKLDTVIQEAKAALASGMSVVIGLQSTGEAAADAMGVEPGPLPGFVSPCKELLVRFIQQHFPIHHPQAPEAAAMGLPPDAIPACQQMRQQLLAQVTTLDLPPNFLDQLIDELGGPTAVAEMTGRKGRVVREQRRVGGVLKSSGRVVYELRAKPDSSEMDSLNVSEREAFLAGSKRVALISDAASTGISLHAAKTAVNQERRLHLTIELPWSADKAIQQLGRSHRTNQVCAPLYKLVVSAAGGEKRFAAAVARRLQSLGALTRGDRRAAAGLDLSESNFDSPWGRKSLRKMYDHIVTESPQLPSGVTVSALLKDLFPAATDTDPIAAAAAASADGQLSHKLMQQREFTQQLLQQNLPALGALQRLAAAEAAAAGSAGNQPKSSEGSPVKAAAAAAAPVAAAEAEEAMLVAALTGKAPPPSAAAVLMTPLQVSQAISELHHELRACCDMMGIGLGGQRKEDTVAEDRTKDVNNSTNSSTPAAKDLGDVRRFLNRLLGLPLGKQNLLFNYFAATLAAEIAAAKAEGRYSEGVSDIHGSSIKLARPPELLWGESAAAAGGDLNAGAAVQTWVNTLHVDRGVSFEDAARRLSHESFPGCSSGFRRSRRPMFGSHLVLLALQKPGQKNMLTIVRPNTGESFFDMDRSDLEAKYSRISPDVAQQEWTDIYNNSLTTCMHGAACANKQQCQAGRRLAEVTILSGSVVRVWGVLESILDRRGSDLNKADRTMRVVRVTFQDADEAKGDSPAAEGQGSQQQPQQQEQQQQDNGVQEGAKGSQQQQQEQGFDAHLPAAALNSPTKANAAATPAASAAANQRTLVGVRYPAHLLSEVVATLASLQVSTTAMQQSLLATWGTQQQQQQQHQQQQPDRQISGWWAAAAAAKAATPTQAPSAAAAAAAGEALKDALGIARIEPPTPVDKKMQAKAFRPPKTLHNYFRSTQAVAAAVGADTLAAAAGQGRSTSVPPAAVGGTSTQQAAAADVAAAAGALNKSKSQGAVATNITIGTGGNGSTEQQQPKQLGSFHKQQQKRQQQRPLPAAKKQKLNGQQQLRCESSSVIIVDSEAGDDAGCELDGEVEGTLQQDCELHCEDSEMMLVDDQAGEEQTSTPAGYNAEHPSTAAAATAAAAARPCEGSPGAGQQAVTPSSQAAAAAAAAAADNANPVTPPVASEAAAGHERSGRGDQDDVEVVLLPSVAAEPNVLAQQQQSQRLRSKSTPPPLQQQQPARQAAASKGAKRPGAAATTAGRGSGGSSNKRQQQQQGKQQSRADKLELLAGMGFTGMKAERALWVCQGDVSRAIEWCLSAGA